MMIPVSFRGIFFVSILILGMGIFVVVNNSKEKKEYDKSTGTIEYFSKEFQDLPVRDKGDYRYLKIDAYPYVFEIYEPNSEPTQKSIDDLKVGDMIDIYYYETDNTREEGLNRYAQFIDQKGQSYFARGGFQKQLGFVVIGLAILLNVMSFAFYKKGKIKW
ncbi:hypothetical protein ACXZ1K_07845 [Pedobacter sp. PWIIR3]